MKSGFGMKSGFRLMVLVVAALVSTSAWAIWNPDTDASLLFNMNFEITSNPSHTATDAKAGIVGTLEDYNSLSPNVFGETSLTGLGFDGNFAAIHDNLVGPGVASTIPTPNDVRLSFPSNTFIGGGQGIFDLSSNATNGYLVDKHTWTFWFNVPDITNGTVIRNASVNSQTDSPNYESYKNDVWEIRILSGKLMFYHRNNVLRMESASTLSELGVTANTWHHAAVVIDRSNCVETVVPTTQQSAKIYVDGLEAPVIITALDTATNMNVDSFYDSPLWIGAGEREFDGLLDDVRLFSRSLTPVEVSILNQPDKTIPIALLPIPRSSNVVIGTGLSWEPAGSTPAPTAQKVYFGTNADANLLPLLASGDGSLNSATPSSQLSLSTVYYWYVKSTISGSDVNGPVWSFTSETGKAINPSPTNGAEDVNDVNADLSWSTPTTATYAVYASAIRSLVESNDISVQLATGLPDNFINDYDPNLRGTIIYWRVNSTYGGSIGMVPGDIWSFRTKPYELVFNTSGVQVTYADHVVDAYTCALHSSGWSPDPCATATLASDGVAIFNFPNGFNYDRRYDIVVIPEYRARDIDYDFNFPTPLAIHVTGDFSFDGRIQIAGDDILNTTQATTFARSGGFPGPKNNQDSSIFGSPDVPGNSDINTYWPSYVFNDGSTTPFHTRFSTTSTSGTAHSIYVPTDEARKLFGPGIPVNPPYKGGGGGGAGGIGGDSGRGYFFGVDSTGPSYGAKEVPVPFGGSGGGWGGSNSPGGAAGGGGVEIVASGNVFFDVNSQILAHGGSQLCSSTSYPAGGGGGGSVKIIAGGNVTNRGIIDVNGGKGGNGGSGNNLGGGGGGGRVAVFYVGTYTNTGTIAAIGGARGGYYSDPCNPGLPSGLAKDGQNGTIYVVNSSTVSLKKASAPTPANGKNVYYPDPCTIQLKWYSGYGGTTDVVYCDTNPNPGTSRGSVAAARGQHSVSMSVTAGNTYYIKVVTDGVSSDIWSFNVVNWQCPIAFPGAYPHPAGLEWDSNHDCVLDIEDFDYFANDWLNPVFGGYRLDLPDFARFANEWRMSLR